MSVWSTSTGRNSVFGAEGPQPPSHLPVHPPPHTHLHNNNGHCFHKRFHNCQVISVTNRNHFCPNRTASPRHCCNRKDVAVWGRFAHAGIPVLEEAATQSRQTQSLEQNVGPALRFRHGKVAMVEVQLNSDTKVPAEMLIAFAVCTTLLVAVHMLALMISTCILPNIEAVCNLHSISLVHESPHERLHWYIEVAWAFSTLLGLLLFLLEIAILCWVKFYDFSQVAAWSACIVLIPVLIIFLAFAIHFYRSLVAHKYEVTVSGIRELELLKEQIESTDVEGRNGVNLLQSGTHIV
ncbi:calcium release-activated calcium channel protein 1 isoform X2 [Orussus abietinus]|uniref:calcium release-activated calcium channel protein 1 isoform X2 n=1 Tax=Orussus abietinus TaxID=222816 RepID=UPI000C7162FE|nr:calcium release-activated calcium channel protein 1 isoform X2 [Orussus abietinus]